MECNDQGRQRGKLTQYVIEFFVLIVIDIYVGEFQMKVDQLGAQQVGKWIYIIKPDEGHLQCEIFWFIQANESLKEVVATSFVGVTLQDLEM